MRGFLRAGFVIVCLMLVLTQSVPAFNISSIVIDPSGPLTPGTSVLTTFKVDYIATGDETFPSDHNLQMSTDLEKPKYTCSLVQEGVTPWRQPVSVCAITESGSILPPPSIKKGALKVTVEGITPTVTQTMNKTLIRVCEFDSRNKIVSCVERTMVIVYVKELSERIKSTETNLSIFKTHIDEKTAMGVETSAAEAKYSEADQYLKSSCNRCGSYLEGLKNIELADAAIVEGERLVDKAWAENEVANAKIPIDNTDTAIEWIKGNSSTADDSQIPAIIAKRELAVSNLTAATDEINNGNYEQAREKAQEAFRLGNELYTDALSLTPRDSCCGFDPILHPLFRAGIAVIILILIGLIWWKKFPEE